MTLGQNGCHPGSASAYSVHVRVHIHHFQHYRLCLCLHHCITNVLVSCLCNFRQPTGSVHLLNWSRLPVLKLESRFLESWLFSPHLVLFSCASAKILGHSVIKRPHQVTNIGHYPRQLWDSKTIQSVLLKNQIQSYKCWKNLSWLQLIFSLILSQDSCQTSNGRWDPLPPPNATAIATIRESSGRPPVPICDSQNGRSNSQDQSAILLCFLFLLEPMFWSDADKRVGGNGTVSTGTKFLSIVLQKGNQIPDD